MEKKIGSKESKKEAVFEEIKGRPQVLLVGNGIDLLLKGKKWNELLENVSSGYGFSAQEIKSLPLPMQYEVIRAQTTEENALNVLIEKLRKMEDNVAENLQSTGESNVIEKILKLDADAIFTCNYTHTLEKKFKGTDAYKRIDTGKKSMGFGRYSRLTSTDGEKRYIFYLHGDTNNKKSIVLGHYEYATHLSQLVAGRKNSLSNIPRNIDDAVFSGKIKSMADLFLIADVYMLAYSLDFSEIDIWWLIMRKALASKRFGGNLFFYAIEPKRGTEEYQLFGIKQKLLSAYGFRVETLSTVDSGNLEQYRDFYNNVCDDIAHRIADSRENDTTIKNCQAGMVTMII